MIRIGTVLTLVILVVTVFQPMISAILPTSVTNVITKGDILIINLLCLITLQRLASKGRIKQYLKEPAFWFFIYIVLQGAVTIRTAHSSLSILLSNCVYILPFFLVLMSYSFLPNSLDSKPVRIVTYCIILLVVASIVLDLSGHAKMFSGRYTAILPVRYGFSQVHGLMPWPNILATLLVVLALFSLVIGIPRPWVYFLILLTPLTIVRAHVMSAFVSSFFIVKRKAIRFLIVLSILAGMVAFHEEVGKSLTELDITNAQTVYRLAYVYGSFQVFEKYPALGIGLNRLSNDTIWKKDSFYWNDQFDLPTELFGTDMSTSDTSMTMLGELGIVGVAITILLLVRFAHLAVKNDAKPFLLFLIPVFLWFYSFANLFFSYNFSLIFFMLYGDLLQRNSSRKEGICCQPST